MFPGLLDRSSPPEQTELTLLKTSEFQGLHFVRLQQHLNGVPVFGAEVVVGVTPTSQVYQLASRFQSDLTAEGSWRLSRDEAIQAVLRSRSLEPAGDAQSMRYWSDRTFGESDAGLVRTNSCQEAFW